MPKSFKSCERQKLGPLGGSRVGNSAQNTLIIRNAPPLPQFQSAGWQISSIKMGFEKDKYKAAEFPSSGVFICLMFKIAGKD